VGDLQIAISRSRLAGWRTPLTIAHLPEPIDRPRSVVGGCTTLHFGRERQPDLLPPIIPPT
jgi:hypothetical protein